MVEGMDRGPYAPGRMTGPYEALLVLSFGGPERSEDVMPFLERVTRGRNVPRARLEEVARHYHHFGGKSPILERTRELVGALRVELAPLPVYLGNRHCAPTIEDALVAMKADGITRALALATSALSSYSGCRAYLDDLERARAAVPGSPHVHKIRPFALHPGYVETCAERLRDALATVPEPRRAHVLLSAHSIPVAMAAECAYESELRALSSQVAAALDLPPLRIVYQSRSGPPDVPWLEPDVRDALRDIATADPGATVVLAPFGFVADHMEVAWDLDIDARAFAEGLGLTFVRAKTANAHPRFVRMVRELVDAHLASESPEACAPGCCPRPRARR